VLNCDMMTMSHARHHASDHWRQPLLLLCTAAKHRISAISTKAAFPVMPHVCGLQTAAQQHGGSAADISGYTGTAADSACPAAPAAPSPRATCHSAPNKIHQHNGMCVASYRISNTQATAKQPANAVHQRHCAHANQTRTCLRL
jgi:hypothetical protein